LFISSFRGEELGVATILASTSQAQEIEPSPHTNPIEVGQEITMSGDFFLGRDLAQPTKAPARHLLMEAFTRVRIHAGEPLIWSELSLPVS
jgi:hypothetical protein